MYIAKPANPVVAFISTALDFTESYNEISLPSSNFGIIQLINVSFAYIIAYII